MYFLKKKKREKEKPKQHNQNRTVRLEILVTFFTCVFTDTELNILKSLASHITKLPLSAFLISVTR